MRQRRSIGLVFVPLVGLVLAHSPPASAQSPSSGSATNARSAELREVESSEWIIWRTFYASLADGSQPNLISAASSALGFSGSDEKALAKHGTEYQQRIGAMERQEKQEIGSRYGVVELPQSLLRASEAARAAASSGGRIPQRQLSTKDLEHIATIKEAMRSRPSLQSTMERDGVAALHRQRKDIVAVEHRGRIAAELGPVKYDALVKWLRENVASQIRTFVAPMPLPIRERDQSSTSRGVR
jgi:hypothetical protein